MGLKGYVTNIPAHLMDAGEVVSSYHELWHVEQSFRMSKHDLRARPVFHHTRDAIEAHLTVVMAALAVARHLQETTGISIKRIIRALKPLQDVTVNLDGHQLTANPKSPNRSQHPQIPTIPRALRCHESGQCAFNFSTVGTSGSPTLCHWLAGARVVWGVYCTRVGCYWRRVGDTAGRWGLRAVSTTLGQWIPTLVE